MGKIAAVLEIATIFVTLVVITFAGFLIPYSWPLWEKVLVIGIVGTIAIAGLEIGKNFIVVITEGSGELTTGAKLGVIALILALTILGIFYTYENPSIYGSTTTTSQNGIQAAYCSIAGNCTPIYAGQINYVAFTGGNLSFTFQGSGINPTLVQTFGCVSQPCVSNNLAISITLLPRCTGLGTTTCTYVSDTTLNIPSSPNDAIFTLSYGGDTAVYKISMS